MRHVGLLMCLALALAALAAACGGGNEEASATQPEPAESQPATSAESTPPATEPIETQAVGDMTLSVYLTEGDTIAVVRRQVPQTEGVARAAMEQLLEGPTADEKALGFSTAIPLDTDLLDVGIDNGIATVDLTSGFASGGGSATMFARLAQVVYTLTQFPTVEGVNFKLDGEPVTTFSSEGIVLDKPQTRADYEDVTPAILVETPAPGETVSSPLEISGTANVFEATVSYSLEDANGNEIAKGFATASCGTGCRGTFETSVEFDAAGSSSGTLFVFEVSAEDGSRTKTVEIPLTFAG